MVRQHINLFSLPSLCSSIIPYYSGFLKYEKVKHLYRNNNIYGYTSHKKWCEPNIKFIDNICNPYDSIIDIDKWKWESYLPNIKNKPIHIDFGSGSGQYLLNLENNDKDWNYIGIEIRDKAILSSNKSLANIFTKRVTKQYTPEDIMNDKIIHFFLGNTIVCMDSLIEHLPNKIKRATILMPDPHFKNSHKKRRMDSDLFFRTDIEDVFNDFKENISQFSSVFKEYDLVNIQDSLFYKNNEGRTSRVNGPLHECYYKRI